jgi:hypothetical protein
MLGEAAMYSSRGSPRSRPVNVARLNIYCFRDSKTIACFGPQVKFFAPRSVLRKGRLRLADHKINLFNAANMSVSLWMSFVDCGGAISMIA